MAAVRRGRVCSATKTAKIEEEGAANVRGDARMDRVAASSAGSADSWKAWVFGLEGNELWVGDDGRRGAASPFRQ